MSKEQWAESTFRRTKSWQRQPNFDINLADITISGLQFLVIKYEMQLDNYYSTHNFDTDDEVTEFKEIQQRYKMINDELEKRVFDTWASPTYYGQNKYYFDANTGLVSDEVGNWKYTIDFNEDETGYITKDLEGCVIDYTFIDEIVDYKLTREDIYRGWDYWLEDV